MNFSDPFGRLAARKEQEYQALEKHLVEAGVDSRDKALDMLARSRKQMLVMGILVSLGVLILPVLWPDSTAVVTVLGGLLLFWLLLTYLRGRRLLHEVMRHRFPDSP